MRRGVNERKREGRALTYHIAAVTGSSNLLVRRGKGDIGWTRRGFGDKSCIRILLSHFYNLLAICFVFMFFSSLSSLLVLIILVYICSISVSLFCFILPA